MYKAVSPEECDDIFSIRSFRTKSEERLFQEKEFGNFFNYEGDENEIEARCGSAV